jgi:hypothetical protein
LATDVAILSRSVSAAVRRSVRFIAKPANRPVEIKGLHATFDPDDASADPAITA